MLRNKKSSKLKFEYFSIIISIFTVTFEMPLNIEMKNNKKSEYHSK